MKLSVENHCIETAAKSEHRRVQSILLQIDQTSPTFHENAQAYELLDEFIRKTDFAKLRATCPELAGSHALEVELKRNDKQEIEILIPPPSR